MDALITALSRDPARVRRKGAIAAMVVVLPLAIGLWALRATRRVEPICRAGPGRLAEAWELAENGASAHPRRDAIHVFEKRPPAGEAPVEWFLLTTLPLDTPQAVAFAVDCYRARWVIEEFFKALKTGCQYEHRQLESADSLLNALAIFAPVAWRLLLLRHLARNDTKAPATAALTTKQIQVLKAVAKKPLPARPTVRDAMLAVAGLGGHLKSNGDPGWLVLGRGLHDLLLLELGRRAREQAEK